MYAITLYTIMHKHKYNRIYIGAILGAFQKTVRFTKTENFDPKGGEGIREILIFKTWWPNGNLFKAKFEFPRSGVEREDQVRASKQIGLGWSEQSKDSQSIS